MGIDAQWEGAIATLFAEVPKAVTQKLGLSNLHAVLGAGTAGLWGTVLTVPSPCEIGTSTAVSKIL
jgi:hypothetical protein